MMGDVVLGHVAAVVEAAAKLEEDAMSAVQQISDDLVGYINRSINATDGEIHRTGVNAVALMSIPVVFDQAVVRSGYYDLMTSFALDLQVQVGHFQAIYAEDKRALFLPTFSISDEVRDILTEQSGATMGALYTVADAAKASLVKLVGRSMAQPSMTGLVQDVMSIVRRMTQVKSIAVEQQMLFFRLLATSTYQAAEASIGENLHYAYVGPEEDKNSDLCAQMIADKGQYTWDQLKGLVNEDGAATVMFGGHYACVHWFRAVGRAA